MIAIAEFKSFIFEIPCLSQHQTSVMHEFIFTWVIGTHNIIITPSQK